MLGNVLGNYRIERELGRGGMGVVYVATHALLGRFAAIKVLLPKYSRDEHIVQRFFNEARAAAAIKHPGIVEIHDFGHAPDGSAYIVMELCDGESLAHRMRRPLSLTKAFGIARHIAGTLAAAHRAGIIHRDLKPDNVFIVRDPDVAGGERTKLLDFGIAKLAIDSAGPAQTATGVIMGTPHYMSPEQCRGTDKIDPRSDLYSLGVILFQMVCGRLPFVGEGAGDIIGAHLHIAPPSPRSIVPELPPGVEQLILALLAKNAADRPADADAVVAAIERLLPGLPDSVSAPRDVSGLAPTMASDQPVNALGSTASTAPPRGELVAVQPNTRRRRGLVGGAIAIAVAGTIAIVALRDRAKPEPVKTAAGSAEPARAGSDRAEPARAGSGSAETGAKTVSWNYPTDLVEVVPGSTEPLAHRDPPRGTFNKGAVRTRVQAHRPTFGYCYSQRTLAENGVVITLEFTIGLAGDVTDASVEDKDMQVATCLANEVRAMRFSQPPSEVRVTYPLKFLIGTPATEQR